MMRTALTRFGRVANSALSASTRLASVNVMNETEYKYAITGNDRVVAGFFKQGCKKCQALESAFEQASDENSDIRFLKLDYDKFDNLSSKCGVTRNTVPAVFAIADGHDVAKSLQTSDAQLRDLVGKLKASRGDAKNARDASGCTSFRAKSDWSFDSSQKHTTVCNTTDANAHRDIHETNKASRNEPKAKQQQQRQQQQRSADINAAPTVNADIAADNADNERAVGGAQQRRTPGRSSTAPPSLRAKRGRDQINDMKNNLKNATGSDSN